MKNKNILIITIVVGILSGIYIITTKEIGNNDQQNPESSTTTSITKNPENKEGISIDLSNEAVNNWDVYKNNKFRFQISYPCDLSCQNSFFKPYPNAYMEETITIPIIQGKFSVGIGVLTKESVDKWNKFVMTTNPESEHTRQPFGFSMEDMNNTIQLPVGSIAELIYHNNEGQSQKAEIVTINNEKAFLLLNKTGRTFPKKTYFIHHTDDIWIQITESYWDFTGDFSDFSTIDNSTKQITVIANQIINTLSFFE